MLLLRSLFLAGFLRVTAFAQTPDVGSGSPNGSIQQAFLEAFYRNSFVTLVSLPPIADVHKFGSAGLVQEYQDAAKTANVKLALIKPNLTTGVQGAVNGVFQVQAAMYAYYNTVTQATAGYPANDTTKCPTLLSPSNATNSCIWQLFDKNYALFAYSLLGQLTAQDFATRDPYYTKWITFGGITGLGPANSAETAVTSPYTSQANTQSFDQGAIYNITSGLLIGRVLAVKEPVYDFYLASGGPTGSLGFPATEELVLSNGMRRQTFEGGSIDYDPASGIPVLRTPIASLTVQPIGTLHLNLGDTRQIQATPLSASGIVLTDRIVAWNTSNGRVVQIQSNGLSATLTGVGGGTATITATGEGKTSAPLTVFVTAPCCQIGEGAPTPSIQQAFQDAVTRDRLTLQLPAASPAARIGNGYAQQVTGTDSTPYLIAVPDGSAAGYVISGAILSQYLALGGPGGSFGYPLSDSTSGGRQTFEHGTLAGNPVQLVSGSILTKWGTLAYETGAAGSPTAAVTSFLTFRATTGTMQAFQNALILAPSAGPLSGRVFSVAGLILAKYNAGGGPGGNLGAPSGDEFTTSGRRHQDFEGGYIDYAPGDAAASVVQNPRQPLITATPASVLGGSRVRLAIGGFDSGASVRVSITGQPDFVVNVPSGAYAWDAYVPVTARSGVVSLRTVSGNATAQGSYTIRAVSDARLTFAAIQGDGQTGAPGAQLPRPLRVSVKDELGNPVPGQTVTFTASPGAQIVAASGVTDANGEATATLRLPMAEAVALVTAQTAHQVVTFSARAAAFSLTNFPALTQTPDDSLGKGALAASAASVLRYHQSRGELPQVNGLADPAVLSAFLKSFCIFDAQGSQICDGFVSSGGGPSTLNLWRAGAFVSNGIDVTVEQPDLNVIRDSISSGSPVLLALNRAEGAHFVVATGIAADASLVIADPAPSPRTTLSDPITGAVRLLPRVPTSPGFLVFANAPIEVSSAAGSCGRTLEFAGGAHFRFCDGAATVYQLDINAPGSYDGVFTDLSPGGSRTVLQGNGATSSKIARAGPHWSVSALDVSFTASSVGNAATLTGDFAPGGLISIFGAGFVSARSNATVQVNGTASRVLAVFPFQVNAQIPPDTLPGPATLTVVSGNGSAQQPITIRDVAPVIFSIGADQAAITNQDNQLNTPSNPAARGNAIVVYGTGFGAPAAGSPSPVRTQVTVVVGGIDLMTFFAGLTPGAIGLYQVNVVLPQALAPGLSLPLYLKQGGAVSNVVGVSVQ